MLKINLMDAQWTLPNRMDDNPIAWMVTINGFIIRCPLTAASIVRSSLS